MSYNANTLKKAYQNKYSEQRKKNLIGLRENIAHMTLTEFSKQTGIQKSNLSALENGDRDLSLFNIQVYKTFFSQRYNLDISTDYLLGYSNNKYADENYQMITRTTGLTDESINTLKEIHNGNMADILSDTLNYLISKDSMLFSRFIDAIGMYFDEEYDTPMRWDKKENGYVPIDDGLYNNPIVKVAEKSVLIGNGHATRSIPVSVLKESYSMYCIQIILEELKREKNN